MSRFRLNTALPWLSWSQVSAYTQCPAKWWFSRRFPPERTPSGLKFGSGIHRALERFYTAAVAGRHAGLDELLAAYLDRWEEPSDAPIQFKEEETPETLKAMAERMLGAFLETVRPGKILAVEEPFTVEVDDGLLVSGIVDLVEVKDGKLWIVDNKTAKHSPADAFDKEQIALYRLGLEELGIIARTRTRSFGTFRSVAPGLLPRICARPNHGIYFRQRGHGRKEVSHEPPLDDAAVRHRMPARGNRRRAAGRSERE